MQAATPIRVVKSKLEYTYHMRVRMASSLNVAQGVSQPGSGSYDRREEIWIVVHWKSNSFSKVGFGDNIF